MAQLRVSAISFLNTAPLMWDFAHNAVGPDFDVHYTIPSKCAEELREGGADIGIIPAALHNREIAHPGLSDLVVVPDMQERKREMFALSDAVAVLPGEVLFVGAVGDPMPPPVPSMELRYSAADLPSESGAAVDKIVQMLAHQGITGEL